jgi:putative transposase
LDLHARVIIGFSCGPGKTSRLVYEAFASAKHKLSQIEYFHTDPGREFKSYEISELLKAFGINARSALKGILILTQSLKLSSKLSKLNLLEKAVSEI